MKVVTESVTSQSMAHRGENQPKHTKKHCLFVGPPPRGGGGNAVEALTLGESIWTGDPPDTGHSDVNEKKSKIHFCASLKTRLSQSSRRAISHHRAPAPINTDGAARNWLLLTSPSRGPFTLSAPPRPSLGPSRSGPQAHSTLIMASRMPQSMLDKLATCQKILGYTFRDVTILQKSLMLGQNKRMATAGDTYVQVALMDRWYSHPKRTSYDFAVIKAEALSNQNLANVGFSKGLFACTLPQTCGTKQQMADTVEAVLAAVYRDALFQDGTRKAINWDEFERVVARLGINHHLIASTADLRWALTPIRTTQKIPVQFFSKGRHFELTKMLAELSGTFRSPSLPESGLSTTDGVSDVPAPFDGPRHAQEERPGVDGDSGSSPASHDVQHAAKVESEKPVATRKAWVTFASWVAGAGDISKGITRWNRLNKRIWGPRIYSPSGPLSFLIISRQMLLGHPRYFGRQRRNTSGPGLAGPSETWSTTQTKEIAGSIDAAPAVSPHLDQTPKQHTMDQDLESIPDASAADETSYADSPTHVSSQPLTKQQLRRQRKAEVKRAKAMARAERKRKRKG